MEATLKVLTPSTMTAAYRTWLLAEAKREVDGGCTRLLSVAGELTVLFGEAMSEWGASRQLVLMQEAITTLCRPRGTAARPEGEESLPRCLFWRQSPRDLFIVARNLEEEILISRRVTFRPLLDLLRG